MFDFMFERKNVSILTFCKNEKNEYDIKKLIYFFYRFYELLIRNVETLNT